MYYLANENATLKIGTEISQIIKSGGIFYLSGNLGMGKTTLSRAILRGLGYQGLVKSPTYTLVEPYAVANKQLYHFDLYRLVDPEELEWLGFRDYINNPENICLIEWPERGKGLLPSPDAHFTLTIKDTGRELAVIVNNSQYQSLFSL